MKDVRNTYKKVIVLVALTICYIAGMSDSNVPASLCMGSLNSGIITSYVDSHNANNDITEDSRNSSHREFLAIGSEQITTGNEQPNYISAENIAKDLGIYFSQRFIVTCSLFYNRVTHPQLSMIGAFLI